MFKASMLVVIAAIAWYMAVRQVTQGRQWAQDQQRLVFWCGLVVFAIVVHSLTQ
jgi:hypothetical protein